MGAARRVRVSVVERGRGGVGSRGWGQGWGGKGDRLRPGGVVVKGAATRGQGECYCSRTGRGAGSIFCTNRINLFFDHQGGCRYRFVETRFFLLFGCDLWCCRSLYQTRVGGTICFCRSA